MEALHVIDPHILQRAENFLGFDELGDRQYANILTKMGQVSDQGIVDFRNQNILDESPVDFDKVKTQFAQVMKRVVTTTEIVEREKEAFFRKSVRKFRILVMSLIASRSRISKTTLAGGIRSSSHIFSA